MINELVVCLKVGDFYVFGCGGEEGEIFYKVGILFEVIFGIIFVIGGFVYVGILVIYCDFVLSFYVIIGYLKKGCDLLDWEVFVRLEGMFVFLMGMINLFNICVNLLENG